jgi:hypothetical protein
MPTTAPSPIDCLTVSLMLKGIADLPPRSITWKNLGETRRGQYCNPHDKKCYRASYAGHLVDLLAHRASASVRQLADMAIRENVAERCQAVSPWSANDSWYQAIPDDCPSIRWWHCELMTMWPHNRATVPHLLRVAADELRIVSGL